jgi:FPC/CPF motif-containing protein YcgG
MSALEQRVRTAFRQFVGDDAFPCLAAKGVVHNGEHELHLYDELGTAAAAPALAADLAGFIRGAAAGAHRMTAFVAVFRAPSSSGEIDFEQRLWRQLQRLHEHDDPAAGWDPAVSADPADPMFSFSFAATALFVVGLHPGSSRLARRFGWPALVFNPHAQFERLRREGHFERLRDRIRERDLALQGSLNPNLANFGERSEAEQYSGRDLSAAQWQCPFHRRAS